MNLETLHSQLKSRQLKSFYVFTGDDWAVQNIYINQICKISGKDKCYMDSFSDIYSKLTTKSFIQKSYVYLVRDDKDLLTNETLQEGLLSILKDNILILLLTAADKRTKFFKTYKDTICEFEPLKPEILAKYIKKKINLSDMNCSILINICEGDYGRCLLEIDKINRYIEDYYNNDYGADCVEYATGMKVLRITEDKAFEILLKDGTIYTPPKDAIFDFVDAILDGKVKQSFDLYKQCLAVGEAVMVMLSVLYNNAKAVLQVQSCESSDISKSTGLSGWQIMNAKKHLNVYSNYELINIMKLCQGCEMGIKRGTVEEKYAMEYIMINVL